MPVLTPDLPSERVTCWALPTLTLPSTTWFSSSSSVNRCHFGKYLTFWKREQGLITWWSRGWLLPQPFKTPVESRCFHTFPRLLFPIKQESGAGQQTGESPTGREIIGYPLLTAPAPKLYNVIQSDLSLQIKKKKSLIVSSSTWLIFTHRQSAMTPPH